ncbi:LysR family transcriptional regulator [Asticcacaulis sp. EMRT-3]|uniref:LysR family transcriptional regulator n=1 Tax=Asticcacaulis sp. EMRT-3 TaxID=3040349 RepID=UPI0024AF1937|nr:LysR family transcriptional regulator [Asticcacaulis sp. EMRT-3]MDI7774490.1 LysR family transcriptional regulator [Asticcacaulis sp. EMRT-3]
MEQVRIDFDDLHAFFRVAETGSFARAAQRLDSSKSLISRRVARLEETLNVQLLQRSSRGAQLTEAGQAYYDEARIAMTQLECAAENASGSTSDISGQIRLTGPVFFGSEYLTPALAEFARLYPEIELCVDFSDEKSDLVRDGYDLAVRIGQLPDSSLIARQLCQSRRVIVGSPSYLAGHPPIMTPEDLSGHVILHYNSVHTQDLWRYRDHEATHHIAIRPHMRSNNAFMLMEAVRADLGLTLLPIYITGRFVQSGEAEIVLNDYDWGTTPVHLLMPPGSSPTRRVRMLVDFLALKFRSKFA